MYQIHYHDPTQDPKTYGLLSTAALASRSLLGAARTRALIAGLRRVTGTLTAGVTNRALNTGWRKAATGFGTSIPRIKPLGWGKKLSTTATRTWKGLPKTTRTRIKFGAVGAAGLGLGYKLGSSGTSRNPYYTQKTQQYGIAQTARTWVKANPKTAAIGGAAVAGGGAGLAHVGIQMAGERAGRKADLSKVWGWRDPQSGKGHLVVAEISPMKTFRRYLPGYRAAWDKGFWKQMGDKQPKIEMRSGPYAAAPTRWTGLNRVH